MISRRTKYGLKALTHISGHDQENPIAIAEISKREEISRKFLESILLSLKKAGLLGSVQGKNGGYYLRKKASDVSLAEVYRVLEGPIAMVPCVSLNFYEKCHDCKDEEACAIHHTMLQIRDNTLQILENTSLEAFFNNGNA